MSSKNIGVPNEHLGCKISHWGETATSKSTKCRPWRGVHIAQAGRVHVISTSFITFKALCQTTVCTWFKPGSPITTLSRHVPLLPPVLNGRTRGGKLCIPRDRLGGSDPTPPLGFSWITSVALQVSTRNLAYLSVHQFDVFLQNFEKFSQKLFEKCRF